MPIATESKAEQRSPEWYASRAGRATASKFATIMANGKGAETYKAELVAERLSGSFEETYTSKAMQDGIEREAIARLKYELVSGNTVTECGFFAHDSILAGASPDGLVNHDGLIEVKSPIPSTHLATLHTGRIPNQYYWQMMGQMWLTERLWCDYVSFHPSFANAQLFVKRVERDEVAIEELKDATTQFLAGVEREVDFVKQYKGAQNGVTIQRSR